MISPRSRLERVRSDSRERDHHQSTDLGLKAIMQDPDLVALLTVMPRIQWCCTH